MGRVVNLMSRVGFAVDFEDYCVVSLAKVKLIICGVFDRVNEVISLAVSFRLGNESIC